MKQLCSVVVTGWLEKFFSLKVAVTGSPALGLALDSVNPCVSVGLERIVKVVRLLALAAVGIGYCASVHVLP